jgi:MFS family permease
MATSDTAIIEGKYISAWAESNRLGRQSVRLYNLIFLRKSQVVLRGQLLQYATEAFGRKSAPYTIWLTFVVVRILWAQAIQVTLTVKQSVLIESFAARWYHWLVAKLFSGMGVGMLQCTMPLYLSEIAPTQLRGFFINAYSLCVTPYQVSRVH